MNNKWRVAFYIRLSVEDEDDKIESNSITNQRKLLQLYIKDKKELEFVNEYVDDGYSGTDFNRPGFIKLLEDIKNGNINTIIVKDLSRLGRNYIEVGNYLEQIFPLYNIRFIAINDNIDSYQNPNSINSVIVPFKNLLNDEYAHDISNKVNAAQKIKRKNGEYIGPDGVYGYIRDPKDKHHLIVDKEAANVVKLIFKMFLEGKGKMKIAEYLNDNGILCPSEYKLKKYGIKRTWKSNNKRAFWCTQKVGKILKDITYCGHLAQGRTRVISYKIHKYVRVPKEEWIIVKNTHEAIISEEDFKKVNEILLSRDTRVGNDGEVYMFAGHLRCAECGHGFTKKYSKSRQYEELTGKKLYHLYCNYYVRSGRRACHKHTIRSDNLEKMVLKIIKKQIELVINADEIANKLTKEKNIDYNQTILKNNLKQKEKELSKYRSLRKDVYEDWKMDIITKEDYQSYSQDYEIKIKEITKQLENIKEELNKQNPNILNNSWIEEFKKYKNIKELNKQIIDSLIDYVEVEDSSHIKVIFRFKDEFDELLKFIKNEENKNALQN